MRGSIYLDTARLGLMTKAAQAANRDFARLVGREGAAPRVETLLIDGLDALPGDFAARYPGLVGWRGLPGLKEALRVLVQAPSDSEVLLAQRSTLLMKLAARSLFRRCGRVLHTDLEWPAYLSVLDAERDRSRSRTVHLPVRDLILRDGVSVEELVRHVANRYRLEGCDGLFLSGVSFDGIRFPIRALVDLLSTSRPPRFVVVDGSQAIAHTPPDPLRCDLLIGGTHKWLGSGHPLGVAFITTPSSREFVLNISAEMASSGDLDDPLLRFIRQLELGRLEPASETVGLGPLFTCMAALADALRGDRSTGEAYETRLSNGDDLRGIAEKSGWTALRPDEPASSGVVLLESHGHRLRCTGASLLRSAFGERGITLTAYEGGAVRMSMPARRWSAPVLNRLGAALRHLS